MLPLQHEQCPGGPLWRQALWLDPRWAWRAHRLLGCHESASCLRCSSHVEGWEAGDEQCSSLLCTLPTQFPRLHDLQLNWDFAVQFGTRKLPMTMTTKAVTSCKVCIRAIILECTDKRCRLSQRVDDSLYMESHQLLGAAADLGSWKIRERAAHMTACTPFMASFTDFTNFKRMRKLLW